jgi:hypothetical protein
VPFDEAIVIGWRKPGFSPSRHRARCSAALEPSGGELSKLLG